MAEFLHWLKLQEKQVWISNSNISKLIKSPSFYDFLFKEGLLSLYKEFLTIVRLFQFYGILNMYRYQFTIINQSDWLTI